MSQTFSTSLDTPDTAKIKQKTPLHQIKQKTKTQKIPQKPTKKPNTNLSTINYERVMDILRIWLTAIWDNILKT